MVRQRRRALVLPLLLIAPSIAYSNAAVASPDAAVTPFVSPAVHYNQALSFRGVLTGGAIKDFDVSGHACVSFSF